MFTYNNQIEDFITIRRLPDTSKSLHSRLHAIFIILVIHYKL